MQIHKRQCCLCYFNVKKVVCSIFILNTISWLAPLHSFLSFLVVLKAFFHILSQTCPPQYVERSLFHLPDKNYRFLKLPWPLLQWTYRIEAPLSPTLAISAAQPHWFEAVVRFKAYILLLSRINLSFLSLAISLQTIVGSFKMKSEGERVMNNWSQTETSTVKDYYEPKSIDELCNIIK